MDNHFHLQVEVRPRPRRMLKDQQLLGRLAALYPAAEVERVREELEEARRGGGREAAALVHARYAYRMYDLSEFMKGLLQRFTQWFNKVHERSGTLWERRFHSTLVGEGVAARLVAAYIDLNAVRAGLFHEPGAYRWCSYGEALAGGERARAGLARVMLGRGCWSAQAWERGVALGYRRLLLEGVVEKFETGPDGRVRRVRRGMPRAAAERERAERAAGGLRLGRMLHGQVRYFSCGAAVGGREFVEEVFRGCRDRFGSRRTSGARRVRGALAAVAGHVWTLRDLRKGV